jgi:ATP-dependent RNA helicase SUPV3L1/SUV3
MDFTEQGGLMWGSEAVGKLAAGPDPLRPQAVAFVDDEAGADVAEKVRRRLQHFIDRKIAAQFEPLMNLQRDETLTGLARGFAFRLVEALGVLPRDGVADEVKALDQDARGALRKHGVRFGQFTIFLPALLKPAPTRLRLVLWSLSEGLDTFPESPPPGLVTIPSLDDVPMQHYTLSGYRPAGARALRIDMLERLADIVRTKDARAGFEATPDMLSITGMTLEQFADLMQGLGYDAEKGERVKQRPAPSIEASAEEIAARAQAEAEEKVKAAEAAHAADETASDSPPETVLEPVSEGAAEAETAGETAPGGSETADEMEVFFTFRWMPRARPRNDRPSRGPRRDGDVQQGQRREGGGGQPRRKDGKPGEARGPKGPKGDRKGKPSGKPGGKRDEPRSFTSGPKGKRDRIDPDNPFAAALMGLKDGKKDT